MTEIITLRENEESKKLVTLKQYELDQIEKQFKKFMDPAKAERKFISFIPVKINNYKIKAYSWIGTIQLNQNFRVQINPKINIQNFLKMLNYVDKDLLVLSGDLTTFEKE